VPSAQGGTAKEGAPREAPAGHALRIVYVVTTPRVSAWWFLRGQLAYLRAAGAEITLISSPEPKLRATAEREGTAWRGVRMAREIAPLKDLRALMALWWLFVRIRPDIVNVSTPKAGLLGGLAARLAGVRSRVYVLRGLRMETANGALRPVLWLAERVACGVANRVVCVSPSLRQRALELRLVSPAKALVIGGGSSNGVDVERFAPTPASLQRARELRAELGIEPGAPVIGFVGRLTRDKGIVELAEAFARLRERRPEARLLLVGDHEDGDPVPEATRRMLEDDPGVIHAGWVQDVAPYFHVCDVVALPTYREGFPNIAVEAASAAKPVVTTDATGARDAVVDGETGLIVPVRDAPALAAALDRLLASPAWAGQLGLNGQRRARESFHPEVIWRGLLGLYADLSPAAASPSGRGDNVTDDIALDGN
jgi:glycosyltransferase involved in cell wall biosynthesis